MVTDTGQQADRSLDELVDIAHQVSDAVQTVISGKPGPVRLALTVLLAEGHILIEDVPGVGKTQLAKALARSIDCSVRRVQFTPDLLPSDITGVSAYNQELARVRVQARARSSPTSCSATRSTGRRRRHSRRCWSRWRNARSPSTAAPTCSSAPFMVIATQNPIEMEGTYPLPEAQRDRFMTRISIGYPDREAELAMLDSHGSSSPLDELKPVAHASDMRALVAAVREVHVSVPIRQYIIDLVNATRTSPELRLGASPRAALHLLRASRAHAALDERDFVIPDDVQVLAVPVLAHRLLPSAEAMVGRELPDQVLSGIVRRLPLPGR